MKKVNSLKATLNKEKESKIMKKQSKENPKNEKSK